MKEKSCRRNRGQREAGKKTKGAATGAAAEKKKNTRIIRIGSKKPRKSPRRRKSNKNTPEKLQQKKQKKTTCRKGQRKVGKNSQKNIKAEAGKENKNPTSGKETNITRKARKATASRRK